MKVSITQTFEVELDTEIVAKWFCGLSDEDQAQFFIDVQRIAVETMHGHPDSQWYYMCGHLKTCECSNEDTREMLRTWAQYVGDPQ